MKNNNPSEIYMLSPGVVIEKYNQFNNNEKNIYALIANKSSVSLEIITAESTGFLSLFADDIIDNASLAVFNGGYFHTYSENGRYNLGEPEGLLVVDSKKLHDTGIRGEGVLLIDNDGKIDIQEISGLNLKSIRYALQLELLSFKDKSYSLLEHKSYRPRTIIGLKPSGDLVLSVFKDGTFNEVNDFLRSNYSCYVAAALDGGLSSQARDILGGTSLNESDIFESAVVNFIKIRRGKLK